MTRIEFQALVLDVLQDAYPERGYEAGEGDDVIVCGGEQFGLHNLQTHCGDVEADDPKLRGFIREHFARMARLVEQHTANDSPAWAPIAPRLRPQIMPASYAEQVPIVHLPLAEDVLIGIVLDSDAGYSYVRQEDAALWGRTPEELFATAVENLNEASRELPMTMFPEPNLAIVIETKDGYDAARILLPNIRQFVAEKLGEPFFAGIPNRDFLIMWSREACEDFQMFCRQRIAADAEQQDHPLSPRILVATADEVQAELEA
jgi:Protein of unknown function (DUF1444)